MNLAKILAPIAGSAVTHQMPDSPDDFAELVAQSLRLFDMQSCRIGRPRRRSCRDRI